jgi:hypothetical protein
MRSELAGLPQHAAVGAVEVGRRLLGRLQREIGAIGWYAWKSQCEIHAVCVYAWKSQCGLHAAKGKCVHLAAVDVIAFDVYQPLMPMSRMHLSTGWKAGPEGTSLLRELILRSSCGGR